ncbi:hypothetical protein JYU34_020673 [Plutella xylostella]|uniref:Uncharacterized protein n=1 Tax=Plutella xylostella TaxID=51655 RepID=A0ABQ7PUU8_PLUXY|nr:hypothetical protein JYU34_020673 [Plutella xylostella]
MRTVSPEIWWGRRKKSPISSNFGQKVPNKMETMLRRSFWKTLEEFSRTTHMTGFKYTVDEMASAAKRKMWRYLVFTFIILGLVTTGFIVHRLRQRDTSWKMWRYLVFTFIIMGLVTTGFIVHRLRQLPAVTVALPSLEHTIQNIDFPAVAFCSYNLINKTRAWDYAEFLHSKKHRFRRWYKNYSVEDIYKNLVNFGALIDFSLPSIDIDFTEFLQAVDGDRGMNLTAPCSEQLLHCNWRGRPHDCSELFALRLTQTGEGDRSNKPYRLDTVGSDNGLSVIVHTARDDDAYLRWTGVGTEVILFNGAEYPLMEGGGILAVPAAVNESTFLLLSTAEVDAPSDVHDVSEARRGCKFGKPGETYIQCLTECRRKTIETLCGCVPFQYMPAEGDTLCRLEQLPCLNKYRGMNDFKRNACNIQGVAKRVY